MAGSVGATAVQARGKGRFEGVFEDDASPRITGRAGDAPFEFVFEEGCVEEWNDPATGDTYLVRSVTRAFFNRRTQHGVTSVGYCSATNSLEMWNDKRETRGHSTVSNMVAHRTA